MIAYRPESSPIPYSSRYTEVHVVGKTHRERRDGVVKKGDALIVLSGKGGIQNICHRAGNYQKPVIPIGCSGGTALEQWHILHKGINLTFLKLVNSSFQARFRR